MFPEAYKRVLGSPGVLAPLAGVTLSRLAIAAQPLSTILLVRGSTGSFAAAGLVLACYSLAAAGSLPVQGRVIDRVGQTSVIALVTVVNSVAFAALIPLAATDAPVAAMAVAGTIAGLCTPPLGSAMRSLWAGLVPDPDLRQAAFTLDAVAIDVAWILGPTMAAAVIAVASPSASLGACVALTLLGSAVFAGSAASRAWRGTPAHERGSSPLRSPGVMVLMGAALGVGIMVGGIEISITAFASDHGAAELGGTLVAIQAVGSVVGGLWFGARAWRMPPGEQLPAIALVFALCSAPLVAVPSLAAAFPLMALSGLGLAPTIALIYLLLDSLAPTGTAVEATGWVLMAIVTGAALGNGLAGVAVSEVSPHAGLAVGVAGGAITLGSTWLGRENLVPRPAMST
ncbi:MAG TPA: MFS transporter [Solirubrobacterales bacterium]